MVEVGRETQAHREMRSAICVLGRITAAKVRGRTRWASGVKSGGKIVEMLSKQFEFRDTARELGFVILTAARSLSDGTVTERQSLDLLFMGGC